MWILTSLLLALAPLSAAPERELPATTHEPRALLYTDDTSGSKLHAETWIAILSNQKEPLETTTDVNAFIARLMSDHWSSVHVIARAEDGEPPWGEALRGFLRRNAKTDAFLHFWKLPDGTAEPEAPFLTTMAMAIWSANPDRSIIGYMMTKSQEPKDTKAMVHPGLVFPDFKGIVIDDPLPLGAQVVEPKNAAPPVKAKPAAREKSPLTDCKWECANEYRDRLRDSWNEHDERTDACIELYGPTHTSRGDHDKLMQCLDEAIVDLENCNASAAHKSRLCMALCEKRHIAAEKKPTAVSKPQ